MIAKPYAGRTLVGLLSLLLAACVTSASANWSDSRIESSRPIGIRVMTFNVRNEGADEGENAWDNRSEFVAQLISNHRPDVVGLQESSGDSQIEDLQDDIEGMTLVVLPGHTQGRRNSVLYKLDRLAVEESGVIWLSDTPDEFSTNWGNTYPRSVSWVRFLDKSNDRTFYVYNTHFDHESENSRRRSALSIVDLIAGRTDASAPVIVTGDFNSPEESVVVKYLQGLESMDVAGKILRLRHTDRLVDTFRVANPNAEVVGTAAPFDRGRLSKKIDYIFIGIDQWKVDSSSILDDKFDGRFPSDHIPVVVDLSWR